MHVPPLSIVWPCGLDVSAYLALGRQVEVGEHACPDCGRQLYRWGGYLTSSSGPAPQLMCSQLLANFVPSSARSPESLSARVASAGLTRRIQGPVETPAASAHGCPLHGTLNRDSSQADRLPARNSAFNATEAAAFQSFDHEGLPLEVVYRIAQQVIRFEAHQQRIK